MEYSYFSSLHDDIVMKLMISLNINELYEFKRSYPDYVNEYDQDILKHFYLTYDLAKSTSYDMLFDFYHSTNMFNLEVVVKRNDLEDFDRILSKSYKIFKFNQEETDKLLSLSSSDEMSIKIIDYSTLHKLPDILVNSNNYNDYDIIKYALDKIIKTSGTQLYSNIEWLAYHGKEVVVSVLLEYQSGVSDAIIGFIKGGYIDIARNYIVNGKYNIEYIINLLGDNMDNIGIFLDMIPNLTKNTIIRLVKNRDPDHISEYLIKKYNLSINI